MKTTHILTLAAVCAGAPLKQKREGFFDLIGNVTDSLTLGKREFVVDNFQQYINGSASDFFDINGTENIDEVEKRGLFGWLHNSTDHKLFGWLGKREQETTDLFDWVEAPEAPEKRSVEDASDASDASDALEADEGSNVFNWVNGQIYKRESPDLFDWVKEDLDNRGDLLHWVQ